jgi:hypothetical protein
MMQTDIHLLYGHLTVVETVYTSRRGCPQIHIDPVFLEWAYAHHSTVGICCFLHVGCAVVQNALLEYGIACAQENPFLSEDDTTTILSEDDLLDHGLPLLQDLPANVLNTSSFSSNASSSTIPTLASFTGLLSTILDVTLDDLISQLHSHFQRAGL